MKTALLGLLVAAGLAGIAGRAEAYYPPYSRAYYGPPVVVRPYYGYYRPVPVYGYPYAYPAYYAPPAYYATPYPAPVYYGPRVGVGYYGPRVGVTVGF